MSIGLFIYWYLLTNILSYILCGSIALGCKESSVLPWVTSLSSYWHNSDKRFYTMFSSNCARLMPFGRIHKERREVLDVSGYLKITGLRKFPKIEFWLNMILHRLIHWKMALIMTIIFWLHILPMHRSISQSLQWRHVNGCLWHYHFLVMANN